MEGTIGEMRIVAFDFEPRNWSYCNGATLAISQNNALFSIIGTMYGGDGRTTFKLPDYQGRVPISHGQGAGQPNYQIGQQVGVEHVTITQSTMASHSHTIGADVPSTTIQLSCNNDSDNNIVDPANAYPSQPAHNMFRDTQDGAHQLPMSGTIGGSMSLDNTGGSQSHVNVQPYLAMHYVICMFGVYPSRN